MQVQRISLDAPLVPSHNIPPNNDVTVLATGAGVTLIGRLIGRIIHVSGQIAMARLLGVEVFGLFALGWTITRILSLITPLGLDKGIVRFGANLWQSKRSSVTGLFRLSMLTSLVSGCLFGTVFFFVSPWLAIKVFENIDLTIVFRSFAVALPFITTLRVAAAATQVSQRMQFAVIAEDFSQPLLTLIFFLFFFATGWQLLGALGATVLSFLCSTILAFYFAKQLFGHQQESNEPAIISFHRIIRFSLPTAFTGVFLALTIWIDRLFIAYFQPIADVGIYQAVSQSSVLFAIILSAFNAIFSPMIAELYEQKQSSRLRKLYMINTKWGLYCSIPFLLSICFASREILIVLFGSEFANGQYPMLLLAIGQFVNLATGAVGYLLIMTGNQNHWFMLTVVAFLLNIGLNFILIPSFGMVGAAIATSISTSTLFIVGILQVRWKLSLWPYDWRYTKGLVAASVTTLLLIVHRFTLDYSMMWVQLMSIMIIALLGFGVTLYLLGLDSEDEEFVRLISARVRG